MREVTRKSFRKKCKTCGRKLFKISQHGNCVQCATEKVKLANLEMKHKQGPIYDKYIKKMRSAIGIET